MATYRCHAKPKEFRMCPLQGRSSLRRRVGDQVDLLPSVQGTVLHQALRYSLLKPIGTWTALPVQQTFFEQAYQAVDQHGHGDEGEYGHENQGRIVNPPAYIH